MGNGIHACIYGLHGHVSCIKVKNKKKNKCILAHFSVLFLKNLKKNWEDLRVLEGKGCKDREDFFLAMRRLLLCRKSN